MDDGARDDMGDGAWMTYEELAPFGSIHHQP
jgi:hypothetical protein